MPTDNVVVATDFVRNRAKRYELRLIRSSLIRQESQDEQLVMKASSLSSFFSEISLKHQLHLKSEGNQKDKHFRDELDCAVPKMRRAQSNERYLWYQ